MAQSWNDRNIYNEPTAQSNKKDDRAVTILAVVLIAAAILIGAAFSYIFISGSTVFSKKNTHSSFGGGSSGGGGGLSVYTVPATLTPAITATPSPTPVVTPTATPAPTATPVPTVAPEPTYEVIVTAPPAYSHNDSGEVGLESVPSNPVYLRYVDNTYNFSCIYPKHFEVYDDGGTTLFTARSPGGTAREIIDVKPAAGKSVERALYAYIESVGGITEFKNKGEDYYVVSQTVGNTSYYKYCKFVNGYMYSFEFISPFVQDSIYSRYIDAIYEEFSVN